MNYKKGYKKSKNFSSYTAGSLNQPSSKNRRKNQKSTISSDLLIWKAEIAGQNAYTPLRSFKQWPVDNRVKQNLTLKGYQYPTQIQEETIEYLISGRDPLAPWW
jgi:superfamily II DNA/RNA helicase